MHRAVRSSLIALVLATAPIVAAARVAGTIDHIEPGTRALHFTDDSIVMLKPGATAWIEGTAVPMDYVTVDRTVVYVADVPATQAVVVPGAGVVATHPSTVTVVSTETEPVRVRPLPSASPTP